MPGLSMRIVWLILRLAVILLPAVWFGLRLLHLKNWIIDDAGISMAYGRNLLHGHGLVAQPGLPPTEGYSNPLWVFLNIPLQLLEDFTPWFHPKILAFVFFLAACFMPWLYFRHCHDFWIAASLPAVVMLGFSAPIGIWAASGLENPLYLALVLGLLVSSVSGNTNNWGILRTGGLIFLTGITRPEGLLYALPAFLTVWMRLRITHHVWFNQHVLNRLSLLVAFSVLPSLTFFLWRFTYFGVWVPNTYFAKTGGNGFALLLDPNQHRMLLEGTFGLPAGATLVIICSLGVGALFGTFRQWKQNPEPLLLTIAGLFFLIFGYLNYILLPRDWMPEFRFGTPYFAFLIVVPGLLLISLPVKLSRLATVPLLFCTFWFARTHEARFAAFQEAPTVPYCFVRYLMVERYEEAAKRMKLPNPSLLTPDCGATYYEAEFPVFDLAGLCDRRYATCTQGKNPAELARLVLEIDKPVFVDLSPNWSCKVRLLDDSRFMEAYFPIVQDSTDACGAMYPFGVYVRKDALNGDSTRILALGNLFKQGPVYRLPVWRSCGCSARHRWHITPKYSKRSR